MPRLLRKQRGIFNRLPDLKSMIMVPSIYASFNYATSGIKAFRRPAVNRMWHVCDYCRAFHKARVQCHADKIFKKITIFL